MKVDPVTTNVDLYSSSLLQGAYLAAGRQAKAGAAALLTDGTSGKTPAPDFALSVKVAYGASGKGDAATSTAFLATTQPSVLDLTTTQRPLGDLQQILQDVVEAVPVTLELTGSNRNPFLTFAARLYENSQSEYGLAGAGVGRSTFSAVA